MTIYLTPWVDFKGNLYNSHYVKARLNIKNNHLVVGITRTQNSYGEYQYNCCDKYFKTIEEAVNCFDHFIESGGYFNLFKIKLIILTEDQVLKFKGLV